MKTINDARKTDHSLTLRIEEACEPVRIGSTSREPGSAERKNERKKQLEVVMVSFHWGLFHACFMYVELTYFARHEGEVS
jgi:hypothetical protein